MVDVSLRASVILLMCFSLGSCIQTYYMDLNCGQSLDFYTKGLHQIRLKFTSRSSYRTPINCNFYLKTGFSDRFMLYFKSVNTPSCLHAYLNVFDGKTGSKIPGLGKQCGYSTTSTVFTTTGNLLTLNFFSDGFSFIDEGFDMVITSYHTGSCFSDEYSCDNGRCVDEDLECNGYNPCGDFSDCPLSAGSIAGIVIGCFFFVVIVVTILVICRRRRRMRYRPTIITETTSYGTASYGYNQPPPAYPTGQQYPPTGQQYPPTGQQYSTTGPQYPSTGQQYGPSAPPPQYPQTAPSPYPQK